LNEVCVQYCHKTCGCELFDRRPQGAYLRPGIARATVRVERDVQRPDAGRKELRLPIISEIVLTRGQKQIRGAAIGSTNWPRVTWARHIQRSRPDNDHKTAVCHRALQFQVQLPVCQDQEQSVRHAESAHWCHGIPHLASGSRNSRGSAGWLAATPSATTSIHHTQSTSDSLIAPIAPSCRLVTRGKMSGAMQRRAPCSSIATASLQHRYSIATALCQQLHCSDPTMMGYDEYRGRIKTWSHTGLICAAASPADCKNG
jgi:hypothetical protein